MDNETEIRRRINYVTDLIQRSDAVINGESKEDYYEYHHHYKEVALYLNGSNQTFSDQIPKLTKPNIFNKRLGGLWTITTWGLINPYFSILLLTISFPISIPYVIVRGIMLTRTKNRIREAKICLTKIVNDLKGQRIEMTSR